MIAENHHDICNKFNEIRLKHSPTMIHFPKLIDYQSGRLQSIQKALTIIEDPRVKSQNELTEISKELRAIDHGKVTELSRRRQFLNNSHELRALRTQLRSAYVAHENMEHKRDNVKIMEDALKQKEKEVAQWHLVFQQAKESLAREREEERQKKFKLMDALKQQMVELQQRRYEEKQANLKEGEIMQEKLNAMKLEDQAERERLKRKRLKVRQEMEESLQKYEEKKKLRKIERMSCNEVSQPPQRGSQVLNAKLEKERRRLRKERLILSERMGYSLLKMRKEKEEHRDFLIDLLIEERNTKENESVRKNLAKQKAIRQSLHNDLEFYCNVIKPQREKQLREENRLAFTVQQKFLDESDRAMKMKADEQLQRDIENLNALKKHMKVRRLEIANEKAKTQKEGELWLAMEKEHEKLIDLKALHMIKSQPPEILKYVPRRYLKLPTQLQFENTSRT